MITLAVVSAYGQTQNKSSTRQPGSVLIYNVLTSSVSNPSIENTRIAITNTHPTDTVRMRYWVIDGSTGQQSSTDSFCLGPRATIHFLASDVDPGVTGYLVASAINDQGVPVSFNYLIGDQYVKFASGHATNLQAVAFSFLHPDPQSQSLSGSDVDTTNQKVTLRFDGNKYSLAPGKVSLGHLRSFADGNQTMLIVNSLDGDATSGINALGQITGTLYSSAGTATNGSPNWSIYRQRLTTLGTGSHAVLGLPSGTLGSAGQIPSGEAGWYEFERQAQKGITAVLINHNSGSGSDVMKGGHNLQVLGFKEAALTLSMSAPSSCQ